MTENEIGPVFRYGDIILWERTLQHALWDWCVPGGVVLDIGANIAGVAIALSRMVGEAGQIHAFECNPRLAEWARLNCQINDVTNVQVIEKAVYSCSGKKLQFFCENSHYGHGSSLVLQQVDSREISVVSVSVDDYCREKRLRPCAIKIDVEGGEYDVLVGALGVLRDCEPTVIFEDSGMHKLGRDPIDLMTNIGYRLYDASLYEEVDRRFYERQPGVSNVLAIPGRLNSRGRFVKCMIAEYNGNKPIRLAPGRYVVECDICGESTDIAWLKLVNLDDERDETMYETRLNWLKHHSCSAIVFRTDSEATVRVDVGAVTPIAGLGIASVRVYRVEFL